MSKSNTESVILRESMLKNIKGGDTELLIKYEPVISTTTSLVYPYLKDTIKSFGYEYEDVLQISRIYAYIFINTYTYKIKPEKLKELKERRSDITQAQIEKQEKTNLITFIRQKLFDLKGALDSRNKSISSEMTETLWLAETGSSIEVEDKTILFTDYTGMGFRKVTLSELRTIRAVNKKDLHDKDGYKVFPVYRNIKTVDLMFQQMHGVSSFSKLQNLEDPEDIVVAKDEIYNPEANYLSQENEAQEYYEIDKFLNMNTEGKIDKLEAFVRINKNNPKVRSEVIGVRKIIKKMRNGNKDFFRNV